MATPESKTAAGSVSPAGSADFLSRLLAINTARLGFALVGIDLLTWSRTLLLDGEHALAEPKKLRDRLLHLGRAPRAHYPANAPVHRSAMAVRGRPCDSVRRLNALSRPIS